MLLNYIRKMAKAPANLDFEALVDQAAEAGFNPIIRAFKRELANNLGLDMGGQHRNLFFPQLPGNVKSAEIFFPAPNIVLFMQYIKPSEKSQSGKGGGNDVFKDPGREEIESTGKSESPKLIVGEISPMDKDDSSQLDNLIANILPNANWKTLSNINALKGFPGKSATTPSEKEIEFAGIFRDKKLDKLFDILRKGAEAVNLDEYLSSSQNPEGDEYFLDRMLEGDFFREEVMVYCRKTNQAIIRAKDRASLNALANAGIKCQCGGPLEKEDVKRLLIIPDAKKTMLKASWNSKIFLVNMLLKIGLTNSEVLVGDEISGGQVVCAILDDIPLLFFLADEEFDAADVAATLPIISNAVVYVVGPEGKSAKELEETLAGHGKVILLSGVDSYNTDLLNNLEKLRESSIEKTLADFNTAFALDLGKLALAKVQQ